MKISCPACEAKYSIADEKVSDRLAKIRCRKCNTTIVIDGKVTPPSVYAADGATQVSQDTGISQDTGPAPEGSAQEYSVDFGDNDQRTLTLGEIIVQYNDGLITAETYLWAEGFSDWTPLGDVGEVVDALHAANETAATEAADGPQAAAPAPTPNPAPALAADERSGAGPAAPFLPPTAPAQPPWTAAAKEPEPPRAAARAAGRSGAASDLFGSFDAAGSEEDVTTSAPHDHAPAAPTGARNESSVLFSLSALTSAAKTSKPSQPPPALGSSASGRAVADDSGLIDLKALTAAASSAEAAPAFATAAPFGLSSPLGVTAPAVATSNEAVVYPGTRNRTGLYIGAGIAIAATVIAVALILRPAAPTATTPTASAAAASPQPAADPQPAVSGSAAAAVTAKPPATGTAGDEDAAPDAGAAEKKSTATTKRWTPPKKSSSGTSTTKSGSDSASTPKPKPKRSACGCAPGDLQCAMRCAAGG